MNRKTPNSMASSSPPMSSRPSIHPPLLHLLVILQLLLFLPSCTIAQPPPFVISNCANQVGFGSWKARGGYHLGTILHAFAHQYPNTTDPMIIETLALRDAMRYCVHEGLESALFLGDAKVLIDHCNNGITHDAKCLPDLSAQQCEDCLVGAVGRIPNCCGGKVGGRVIQPTCNLRFETYRFHAETAAPPPLRPYRRLHRRFFLRRRLQKGQRK
ncbi:unnamed protein product [Linum tenue]|uniref:Gnk2-homologous domain-containing protein n=1 Tax=Linum tenue TaxID=586396 RepID=A0AAV0GVW4_9ROSI|nr:unnamed protein product [Linum tenue]